MSMFWLGVTLAFVICICIVYLSMSSGIHFFLARGARDRFMFPRELHPSQTSSLDGNLLGSVVRFNLENLGSVPCGCTVSMYLTQNRAGAPWDDVCDAAANGYGCAELDLLEGNSMSLGSALHLCDDHEGNRDVFMCGPPGDDKHGGDGKCLSERYAGKMPGGANCDAWGCGTNTAMLKEAYTAVNGKHMTIQRRRKVYGSRGGFIDPSHPVPITMSVYFAESYKKELANVWVQLLQKHDEEWREVVYPICNKFNYTKHFTQNLRDGGWRVQNTYWGDGSLKWLNGPCPPNSGAGSACSGNPRDHVKNVRTWKVQT